MGSSRDYNGPSEEHQPVTWFKGYPVYLTHIIMAAFAVSMVITGLMLAFNSLHALAYLPFDSERVLRGQVWRIVTYGFYNPPSIQLAIDLMLLVWFGREVERYLGRRGFVRLYGGIYFLPPLLFTLAGLFVPLGLAGNTGALAVFVAFATLYPEVELMFNVMAKWAAIILVAIFSLIAISSRNVSALATLWITVGFAHVFIRHAQGRFALPRFSFPKPRRKPELRVLPDLPPRKVAPARPAPIPAMAEIDALLDKIAHSGLSSLTPHERAKLEKGREDLLKKESGRT